MRKHAGSWMIKVILFVIVIVFVFWGVGTVKSRRANRVAEINGEVITVAEYKEVYENLREQYRRVYGNSLNDELLKMLNLKQQALWRLIDRKLMLQQARKMGLKVTDEELASSIQSIKAFQTNGVFDPKRYRRVLARVRTSPEAFEVDQRQSLALSKLKDLLLAGVTVSEGELRTYYDWLEARVDIQFVLFAPADMQVSEPGKKELESYFENHKQNYKTAPKVKVRYISLDPRKLKDDVEVSPDDIQIYYEDHLNEFKKEKTVEARHILIKVAPDADKETVAAKKAKAEEIYRKAAGGQDFVELAKKYSEGPTGEKGGYLGTFGRSSMVKPFADKAFSMEAGQISEPVRTRFGWHIIKVEKVNPAKVSSLEEVEDTIKNKIALNKARNMAYDRIEAVYEMTFEGNDLQKIAREEKIKLTETDYFTANGPAGKVEEPDKFAKVAFELEPGETSDILELGGVFYLLQVVDKVPSMIPELEKVSKRVRQDYIKSKQDEKARQEAERFLEKARENEDFKAFCSSRKIPLNQSGFFKRNGTIPAIGYEPAIIKAAFELTASRPFASKPLKGRKGYYVIRLKERKTPSDEQFAKESKDVGQRLVANKKNQVFDQWLQAIKKKSQISIEKAYSEK